MVQGEKYGTEKKQVEPSLPPKTAIFRRFLLFLVELDINESFATNFFVKHIAMTEYNPSIHEKNNPLYL